MKIAIIGGGAAGMMCATTILEHSPETDVFLIEKNAGLGKKVLLSGGGRCNVTTGITDLQLVLCKYPRGSRFLQASMRKFSPEDVFDWFETHGVALKTEEDMRVFPRSDNGRDIINAFTRIFKTHKIELLLKHTTSGVTKLNNQFKISFKNAHPLVVDRVVLTTGGQAYRMTGSQGDGYKFAQDCGHHLTDLASSLNSFVVSEKWIRDVSGVSRTNAVVTAHGTKKYSATGPFMFTHTGLTGPAIFALSSLCAFEKYDQKNPMRVTIDLTPDSELNILHKKIQTHSKTNPKKAFKNILAAVIPISLSEILCDEMDIPHTKKCAEIDMRTLHNVTQWIKHVPLTIIGRGAGDEFVTAGGIELSEVNPRTMESLLCPDLYFAGEILNIDGFTGGFNLQAAWATGRVAGINVLA